MTVSDTVCNAYCISTCSCCLYAAHHAVNRKAFAVQRARDVVRISFGAQQINDLLGGGLESKAITEMFGEYRWDSLPAYMLLLLATIR